MPDGRGVFLLSKGPEGNWIARLEDEDRGVSGRSLRHVLRELIGMSEVSPRWLLDLVGELTAHDTPAGRRYASEMDQPGGANKVSLRQARENFRRIGKSDPARRGSVRPPLPEEQP